MFITNRAYNITRRGYRLKIFEELSDYYVKIPNELVNDRTISWKAKGLFCHMASKRDTYNFTVGSLATQFPDGKAAVFSALDELKNKGWLIYTKRANGQGKYKLTTTLKPKAENQMEAYPESDNRTKDTEPESDNRIKDTKPESDNRTKQAKPKSDNPDMGFPIMGNSDGISNNDAVSNKDIYKGGAEKSGEKNFKHVQDASIALSTAMDIDQIIQKHTGGKVNVH